MNKSTGLLLIIAITFLGLIAVGACMSALKMAGSFSGHIGYCASVDLPGFSALCIAFLLLTLALLIYLVWAASFPGLSRQTELFQWILVGGLVLLAYPLFSVCRFPFVDTPSYFHDGQGSGKHNPLGAFGAIYAITLLLVTLAFRYKRPALKRLATVAYVIITGFLLTIASVYWFARYETCFG